MKNFLKQIIFFSSILILIMLGLEFYFTQELKNRNSEGEIIVWNDLYENNLSGYHHFIYGSSRAWVHIDPLILEKELGKKYYNLGADGQNFLVQRFRHEELKKRTEIKSIIYSVDLFTLDSRKYIFDYYQFLPFMLWQENGIKSFLKHYEYYSDLDFYLPLSRYFGHRDVMTEILFKKDSILPSRIRGYKGQERNWNDDLKNARKKEESINIEIDKKLVAAFEEFLKNCSRDGINVVLVYTPEYIEGQKFVNNRSQIIDIYKDLSYKYSIPFLDFSNDSLTYNKNYFYNASHLNKTGAELFTKNLAERLKDCDLL